MRSKTSCLREMQDVPQCSIYKTQSIAQLHKKEVEINNDGGPPQHMCHKYNVFDHTGCFCNDHPKQLRGFAGTSNKKKAALTENVHRSG